jgi:hypothetical protein
VKLERDDEPLTMAHAAAEGEQAAIDAAHREEARKAAGRLEAAEGPASFTEPSMPSEPATYNRPYLQDGHGAPSPLHGQPNMSPVQYPGRGMLAPLQATGPGPVLESVAAHDARSGRPRPVTRAEMPDGR